jgi:hypothetical protein
MSDGQQTGYRRLYPMQESLVFDGGIDTKFPLQLIPENESPDCLNVEFVNGAVASRQGATRLNTISVSPNAFDGLYTRRANDGVGETMVAFVGGSMYTLAATTFITVPSAQSVFTMGNRVGAELAENYIFMGNGGVNPYKYDGSLFTVHGVYAPTQTATVASASTGSLTTNGVYMYRYTNVNTALVESNMSPAITFTVSNAGLAVLVSNIASGSTASMGVNARYLYRTLAGGSSYFRVTKLLDTSTTSFTDTLNDTALGSPAPTDNGVPPNYNAIIYSNSILFMNDAANPGFVWYTPAGTPYTVKSTNFFKVGDNAGDLVKGFANYDNYVVIFCEQSTWINFMPNPADDTTWRRIKTNSPYGSKSPYCALKCNVHGQDLVLFPAFQSKKFVGFAALSGMALDPSVSFQAVTTAGSDLQSQVIEPDMFLVQTANPQNISGIVYKNRAFISLTYGNGNTTNNRVYVWDFSITNIKKDQPASWVPWTGVPYDVAQFTIYGGKLYGASSDASGFVYQLADTNVYNDNGSAINAYYWTKEYAGFVEDTALTKDFRYINLLYDNFGSYSMNLVYRTDSQIGTGTTITVSLSSGGTVWGSRPPAMVWGTSLWGGGVTQTENRIYLGGSVRGKRLQFRFDNQNTINQRFRVSRAQFLYNIRGYR